MPDEQTVNDHVLPSGSTYAREQAAGRPGWWPCLHGYDAYEESRATQRNALKAEYEALTGEAYRSREEEQADNLEAAKERRQQRIETQLDSDRQIIADAKANGFKDCVEVFETRSDGSIPSTPRRYSGATRSRCRPPLGFRAPAWKFVFIIPDGRPHGHTPRTKRTGCYPDALDARRWPLRTSGTPD